MLSLRIEFLFAVRTRFAVKHDKIRNDVRRHATVDHADVRSSFLIDTAEFHRRESFGGDLDCRDSLFRRDAGVRLEPVNPKLHVIRRRTFGEQKSWIVRIENDAVFRFQLRHIDILCAQQSDFFANRKDCFDGGVRDFLFLKATNDFDDHNATALVVAAEDRRAISANYVAFDNRLDAFAGNDRVHMRAHHYWLCAGNRACESRNNIAAVAANLFAGVVDLNLGAHFFAVLLNALGDVAFFARVAVDLDELKQKILNTLLINHRTSRRIAAY